jgi:oligogalacturonide lyase
MSLLTTGHKPSVADHLHPTFSSDGARIEIQSAMLSEDNRSMNICIVPVLPGGYNENRNNMSCKKGLLG